MEAASSLDLSLLIPSKLPHELLSTSFDAASLSACFIYGMLGTTILAAAYVLWRWARAGNAIRFLLTLIHDARAENLAKTRRDLLSRAQNHNLVGDLWAEFDETLVESHDGRHLRNTVDASYFFSTHTLARGITESRLIAALPGVLTAFGVLGTFVGLQLGLSNLDLTDPNVTSSMQPLIRGAGVAFSTSVWGVATSVVFNLFEKIIEQNLRKRIWHAQQLIDRLFPRSSPDQLLVSIDHSSSQSRHTLAGLAEQIGLHMQTAIEKMSTDISENLGLALRPSLAELARVTRDIAQRHQEGAQEALESLVQRFSQSLGRAGEEQRRSMETSTTAISSALADWQTAMSTFAENVDLKLNSWTESEHSREAAFQEYLAQLEASQNQLVSRVNEAFSGNAQATSELISASEQVVRQNRKAHESIENATGSLAAGAELLEQSIKPLEALASHFRDSAVTAMETHRKAAESLNSASQNIAGATSALGGLASEFARLKDEIRASAESMAAASNAARDTFSSMKKSQEEFLESLATKTEAYGDRVNQMLVEYTEQVAGQTTERLSEWNKGTQEFTQAMADAVSTIRDVVAEIEDLLPQGN